MGDQIYSPVMQVFTSDGDPGVGYKLYTYEAGTTTPKTVYTDEACTVAASNPVVFDSRGEAVIYYDDEYKFVLKTDADVTVWTVDSVGTAAASSSSTTYSYYPDSDESDQGVTASGTGDTIYDIVTALGTDEHGLIVLRHNGDANTTEYILDTDIDLTLYPYLFIEVQPGAMLARTTGDETLTLKSPEHLITAKDQRITSVDMIDFDAPGEVYAEWWGAVGDGTTDDTSEIQIAIDLVASMEGGLVQLLSKTYSVNNLELKSNVSIAGVGTPRYYGYSVSTRNNYQTILEGNDAGDIIGTPTSAIYNASIENVHFHGMGAGTAIKGVYLDNCNKSTFRHLTFDNLADQAIRIDEGNSNTFEEISAQNCLLDTTRAAKIGVIDIGESQDNFLTNIEATASLTALTDSNMYICAIALNDTSASSNFLTNCIGELSDVGIYIHGAWNSLHGCRADLNFGHGIQLTSSSGKNRVIGSIAMRNSNGSDNTYDGMNNAGAHNIIQGCISDSLNTDAWQQRYGFYDSVSSSSNKNYYSNCYGSYNQSGLFYGADYLGASFGIDSVKQFTADDATPSVEGGHMFWFKSYTGATDITDFDDGTPGKVIRVIDTDATGYITIKHNSNIATTTGSDVNLTQNAVYSFIYDNGVWRGF
jgi:parallel beta-helix repeat protein